MVAGTQAAVTKVNRTKNNRKPASSAALPTTLGAGLTPPAPANTTDKTVTCETQTVSYTSSPHSFGCPSLHYSKHS